MRLSKLCRVIMRGSDGQPEWRETSQLFFPKGGKQLTFKSTPIMLIFSGICVFIYAQFQAGINPDSNWAKNYRGLVEDPMQYFGIDQSKPRPSIDEFGK